MRQSGIPHSIKISSLEASEFSLGDSRQSEAQTLNFPAHLPKALLLV
jgi:hypothetical protein